MDFIEKSLITQLEYAVETMLDIHDRVHTYNQQSQLAVYLNAIANDPTRSNRNNDAVLTQLEIFIKTNLICSKYKKAITAITLFAFPFADTYLADLQPRNICDYNTINVTSVDMLSTAQTQITQLSNRIITSDLTVNDRLDSHIHRGSFKNESLIGPFYRW